MTYHPETYWPERYKKQGDTYVAKGGRKTAWESERAWVEPLFEHLPKRGRVLDFGCGPGRFRPALEARGLAWEGIDLIPGLSTVETLQQGRYDAAVAIVVLQHIVDGDAYRNALLDIYSSLADDGVLLVVDAGPIECPDPHMCPRGPVPLSTLFRDDKIMPGEYGHWVGLFWK